jgi:glycosyltransferase involved in cell wall biosynthesis
MKIGINARFLTKPFTGIGQYTRNLIPVLAKIDAENEYFLFTPELVDINLPDNCHQIRVVEKEYSSESIKKAHWEQVLVPKEMERTGINLAHFLYPCNPRRKLPMPTIVTVHDVIPWRLQAYRQHLRSKIYHLNARLALKKSDHIITVSEFSKSEVIKYLKIKEKNISVIPLAPPSSDTNITFPDLNLRRKFFLYVGGYDDRKNVPRLIQAYQKHIAPTYAIDLILVGGKNKGLEELITDEHCDRVDGKYPLKIKGKVVFTDTLDQSELMCLYKQALALVHVSEYEGFNLAIVEALSAGIPIIASDIPVHHEVTSDNALFVNPLDINSIGNGMHRLINDHALQKELSEKGKQRAKDFSWEKTAEETLYVYNLFA